MRLLDVVEHPEATFFRCLHDEKPDDPRVEKLRDDILKLWDTKQGD